MREPHTYIQIEPSLDGKSSRKIDACITSFLSTLDSQKHQYILWFPVLFACGIGFYFSLPFEPSVTRCIYAAILALMPAALAKISAQTRLFWIAILFIAMPALGFLSASIETHLSYTPMLKKEFKGIEIDGTIENIEFFNDKNDRRILLSNLNIDRLQKNKTPKKIRLRLRGANEPFHIGQRIKTRATIMPISGSIIGQSFDFKKHFYFQKIGAVGFAYNMSAVHNDTKTSKNSLETLRNKIAVRIHKSVDTRYANIIEALIIGNKAGIEEADYADLRKSGLAHLLAISGLHIGLVAGAIFF